SAPVVISRRSLTLVMGPHWRVVRGLATLMQRVHDLVEGAAGVAVQQQLAVLAFADAQGGDTVLMSRALAHVAVARLARALDAREYVFKCQHGILGPLDVIGRWGSVRCASRVLVDRSLLVRDSVQVRARSGRTARPSRRRLRGRRRCVVRFPWARPRAGA